MEDLLLRQHKSVLLHRKIKFVPAKQFSTRANNLLDPHRSSFAHRILHLKPKQLQPNPQQPPLPSAFPESSDSELSQSEPPLDLFPERHVRANLSWHKVRGPGAGLFNAGNTCFLNSVLQALAYTPPLEQLATSLDDGKRASADEKRASAKRASALALFQNPEPDSAVSALVELFKELQRGGRSGRQRRAVSAQWFVRNLPRLSKSLTPGMQHDAHELLRSLLDEVQRECLLRYDPEMDVGKVGSEVATTTVVHRVFGGSFESLVRCKNAACLAESNTVEPFLDLSLGVAGMSSVESCLESFAREEQLGVDNKWRCPHCDQLVQASKRLRIARCPNVLVIHLKRFGYGRLGRKVRSHINFSTRMTLNPSVLIQRKNVIYSLYAVLVHSGRSASSGHYVSFVRAANGLWYEMNDTKVRQVSIREVLAQEAYILFYTNASNDTLPTLEMPSTPRGHYLRSFWPGIATSTTQIIRRIFLRKLHLVDSSTSTSMYRYPVATSTVEPTKKSSATALPESIQLVQKKKSVSARVHKGGWQEALKKNRRQKGGVQEPRKRKYLYDDWDSLLDAGRTKKVKSKDTTAMQSPKARKQPNPYQAQANRKQERKDKNNYFPPLG